MPALFMKSPFDSEVVRDNEARRNCIIIETCSPCVERKRNPSGMTVVDYSIEKRPNKLLV